jgi:hypothetical protein
MKSEFYISHNGVSEDLDLFGFLGLSDLKD